MRDEAHFVFAAYGRRLPRESEVFVRRQVLLAKYDAGEMRPAALFAYTCSGSYPCEAIGKTAFAKMSVCDAYDFFGSRFTVFHKLFLGFPHQT